MGVICQHADRFGEEKMPTTDDVRNLLEGNDGKIVGVTIHGSFVRLDLENGDALEIAREHIGGIDWLVVKLNGKRVHQG